MEYLAQVMGVPRDPRIKDWEFLSTPKYVLSLIGLYLYAVCYLGPRMMRERKAFNIKWVILIYNLAQMLLNLYFATRIGYLVFVKGGHNIICQPLSYKTDENSIEILNTFFWYLWVRVADFLDTIFFVMTKKFNHVSLLHVSHHSMVVFGAWLWFQFAADGHGIASLIMNACVHVIMYGYYFLAACGPAMKPYLWWKKHLTTLQIVQFFIGIFHSMIPLFYDCGYPARLIILGVPQGSFLLYLFLKFYYDTYIKRNKQPIIEKSTKSNDVIDNNNSFKTHCFAGDSVSNIDDKKIE